MAVSKDYTVSGNTQTNAGEYTMTVVLNDKANTKWTDNSTDEFSPSLRPPPIQNHRQSGQSLQWRVVLTVSGVTTEGSVSAS